MAEINIGNNANLLKGAIDSHDTQINNDYSVDNSVTNNTTNNTIYNTTNQHNIYEAPKTSEQLHSENIKVFLDEVLNRAQSLKVKNGGTMLDADDLHHLNMLRLQLMLSRQEADSIISQVQQSLFATHTFQQNQHQNQLSANLASIAPPLPQFNPQEVQLNQMQGWNPLQAAQQIGLGLGAMPTMPKMPHFKNTPNNTVREELVIPEESESEGYEHIVQYGIIFTDSLTLANKYNCEIEDVYAILKEFIDNSAQVDQHWYLLDVEHYREQLGRDSYWGDYNELLSNYIQENGFHVGVATPVFIIGGSDVIPVPQLENPQYSGMIPTDMAYCFSTTFFSDLWEGDHYISTDYVRNTVSRLPLECGEMKHSIQDDLLSYFNLCMLEAKGIKVNGVVMASNVEWTDNSITMSQHLPLIFTKTADKEEVYQRMYLCPKLVTENSESSRIDEKVLKDYQSALQHAGMLLFNLHGSDEQGSSGFYSNSAQGDFPQSFNIELMKQSNARIFNTVACFGARFDGYERNDSMLMSALLGGGKLLYAGSTVSVPMIDDDEQDYPDGVTQYPGSGSEKFMPLYCYYQFCGLPAGQAMMQAKLDYFNTFRHIERDDFSLSTALMFGLYGNPMLQVQARQDVIDQSLQYEVLPRINPDNALNPPVQMKRFKCIIKKQQLQESKSLLNQIQGLVDQNLSVIHNKIEQNLYNTLGLDPRWLDQVEEYSIGTESGYTYCYDLKNKLGKKTLVEVNKHGIVTRKIKFK